MNTHSLSVSHSKAKIGLNTLQTFALNFMSTKTNESNHNVNLSIDGKKTLSLHEYISHPKLLWAFLFGHLWLVRRKMYSVACWNAVTLFVFYLLYSLVSYVINPEYIVRAPRFYESLPWYILGFYLYQIPASYVFLALHDKLMLKKMKKEFGDSSSLEQGLNASYESVQNQVIIEQVKSNSDMKTVLVCVALSIVVNLIYGIVLFGIITTTSLGFLYQNNTTL